MKAAMLATSGVTGRAVAIGDTSDILSAILDPAVELALWQRLRPDTLDWIDALEWDEIDDINAHIAGPQWIEAIGPLLTDAGYPQTDAGQLLAAELAERAGDFAALMGCERLHLRLEVIETDACRKFHVDYVTARLLMPLHGPGTQWIEVAHGSDAPINQLSLGDVAIFKGRRLVEEPAILHRSPPVAASRQTRLLCVINPLEGALEPERRP